MMRHDGHLMLSSSYTARPQWQLYSVAEPKVFLLLTDRCMGPALAGSTQHPCSALGIDAATCWS